MFWNSQTRKIALDGTERARLINMRNQRKSKRTASSIFCSLWRRFTRESLTIREGLEHWFTLPDSVVYEINTRIHSSVVLDNCVMRRRDARNEDLATNAENLIFEHQFMETRAPELCPSIRYVCPEPDCMWI